MLLNEVQNQIPEKLYKILQKRIKEFNPPQTKAIKKGLLHGKNILVSAPTASGKTLIAELAMVKQIFEHGGKAIYTVPLKALAFEKYNEFKTRYSGLGIKIALSIGDLDSADNYLHNYDIIICSNEKLDSLIRHHANWLNDVKVVVIDEVHLLNELDRGATLEVIITMLNDGKFDTRYDLNKASFPLVLEKILNGRENSISPSGYSSSKLRVIFLKVPLSTMSQSCSVSLQL